VEEAFFELFLEAGRMGKEKNKNMSWYKKVIAGRLVLETDLFLKFAQINHASPDCRSD